MGVHSLRRRVLLGFLVSLLFAASFCQADDKTVEVVGTGECADCKENNIKTSHAFKGLRVTIDCKVKDGHFKTKGVGELDEEGKFKVSLPKDLMEDGDDKEECYAQLHSASSAPCPAHNGLEATKIVAKSNADAKHTFEPVEKLKFSTALCTSATFWPYYKHPPLPKLPPLPKIDPWKHHFGHHFNFPPFYKKPFPPIFKKPQPPLEPKKPEPPTEPKKPLPPPEPKKPLPPSEPKKPKSPPKKPLPPSEPNKPKPPSPKKPLPPSQPKKPKPPAAPKKPLPPSEPKKPKPPAPKKPLPPSEPKKPEPPVVKPPPEKPLPPPAPIKEPCPPIPKIPKIPKYPKIPPFPKIPPKYFHHHPYFPPLPPHAPHA